MTQSPNEAKSIDEILQSLVLQVGQQVTEDYTSKNGVWEGMSVKNVYSLNSAKSAIRSLIEKEVIGEDESTKKDGKLYSGYTDKEWEVIKIPNKSAIQRNRLRIKQRAKLKEVMGGE